MSAIFKARGDFPGAFTNMGVKGESRGKVRVP